MDSLQDLLALLSLDFSEIKERYKIKEEHVETNAIYQNLSGLTEVYNPGALAVRFFIRNDKVVLIYSSDPSIVDALNGKEITEQYGEQNHLRSRAGKRSNLMVYPEAGFAAAIEANEVQFIELFQPTTLKDYQKDIYIEIGPFIR